jgi:hypothetical protein
MAGVLHVTVGAAVADAQMMTPALATLASENQAIDVPAVTARLLIWAFVWSRVGEVPSVK